MMQQYTFYLHEDEWAMIDILPAENVKQLQGIAREAQTFGEEHFDGIGWTDMYSIPRVTHSLSIRAIEFAELKSVLKERFLSADSVQTGYSSYRETLPDCFAFVEAEKKDGAFYGKQMNGIVTGLHLLPSESGNESAIAIFTDILHALGMKHNLVLADWWSSQIVDLHVKDAIAHYMRAASE